MFRFSWLAYINNNILSQIYKFIRRRYNTWRWIARYYNGFLDRLAFFNANLICDWATYKVPAYRHYIKERGIKINFWNFDLNNYPETNKNDYCKKYDFASRTKFGKLVLKGSTIDESSGSTGVPFNWVRSGEELRDVHTFSSNYMRMAFPTENLITLNAFSMGSWATGINTTLSMVKLGAVKSIGPDIAKILDTMEKFGNRFNYLICGYPPFLKHLCDVMEESNFPWQNFNMYAIVGGEGMSETMRDYLEKKFKKVRSGYGATDIQLGVGGESSFSVWLRKEMIKNIQLKTKILGKDEARVPMIFHYNPLDHYIEINPKSEVVITINNFSVMSPRIRYNIEDEGIIITNKKTLDILASLNYDIEELKKRFYDDWVQLPFLVLYGRKDGTISYMGANIYPQDIEAGLYDNQYSSLLESFCLSLDEDKNQEVRPKVHLEIRENIDINSLDKAKMVETFRSHIVAYLAKVDKDFAQSIKEDKTSEEIQIDIQGFREGIFKDKDQKRIKNKYLVK